MYVFRVSQPDPAIDTSRVEEIPAKEPKFHAVPLKSVLKKRGSGSGPGTPQNTPTQENRPLTLRQELQASFKLVPPPSFPQTSKIRLTNARSVSVDVEAFGESRPLTIFIVDSKSFSTADWLKAFEVTKQVAINMREKLSAAREEINLAIRN